MANDVDRIFRDKGLQSSEVPKRVSARHVTLEESQSLRRVSSTPSPSKENNYDEDNVAPTHAPKPVKSAQSIGATSSLNQILASVFRDAQLPEEFLIRAIAWCEERGAVKLSEVLQYERELGRHLCLKVLQAQRLRVTFAKLKATSEAAKTESDDGSDADEVVPGLGALLEGALLGAFRNDVEAWAEDVGVDSIGEFIEFVGEVEDKLQLKPIERARLRRVLAAHQSKTVAAGGRSDVEEDALRGLVDVLETAHLPHLEEAALEWCEEYGIKTIEEVGAMADKLTRHLNLGVKDQRHLIDALTKYVDVSAIAVASAQPLPGLPEILSIARLTSHLTATLEWCNENGAATVEELADSMPELSRHLALKLMDERRLQKAFVTLLGERGAFASELALDSISNNELLLKDFFVEAILEDMLPRAKAWCEELGVVVVDDLKEFWQELVEALDLKLLQAKRLKVVIQRYRGASFRDLVKPIPTLSPRDENEGQEEGSTAGEPCKKLVNNVIGVEECMREAVLMYQLPKLQAWCAMEGAVLLEEVAEEHEEIERFLGLKIAEIRRLRKVMKKAQNMGPRLRLEAAEKDALCRRKAEQEHAECEKRVAEELRHYEQVKAAEEMHLEKVQSICMELEEANAEIEEMQTSFMSLREEALQATRREASCLILQLNVRRMRYHRKMMREETHCTEELEVAAIRHHEEEEEAEAKASKAKAKSKGKAKAKSKAKGEH